MGGITVFCFWASYAVALGLELSRLVFQSRVRQLVLLGFAAAGLVAHTLFLGYQSAARDLPPLSSLFDWLLILAWILVALYLYLAVSYRELALGVFLLPVVLGLVTAAWVFVDRRPAPLDTGFWAALHGGLLALGAAAVVAASVAGLMYLVQSWRLKGRGRVARVASSSRKGLGLPSLEALERINHRAITVAFPLLTLGFALGVALALSHHEGGAVALLTDPTMIAAAVAWAVFALLLHVRRYPLLRGRRDAVLTIVAFVFLMLTLPVILKLEQSDWHQPHSRQAAIMGNSPQRAGGRP